MIQIQFEIKEKKVKNEMEKKKELKKNRKKL